ncbi:MAG: beta-lactamase family protein [Caldilinea sp.]|nr:beta-lactamase family protein [Caldilinea sp.]MDW8440975.1 serine hydrolase domain-containing protein [Caldilineaceae bacterium]
MKAAFSLCTLLTRSLAPALLLFALLFTSVRAQSESPIDPVDLEVFMDGLMAAHLESHHIPGATLVIVQGDKILLAKGYGYADLKARTPVDPERTLFRPGSTSKLVTWTAVMQQVEQGNLDLDTDVNAYLDFPIPATFPEPITLAHLLSHTPGFEDIGEGLFVLSADELLTLEAYLKQHLPARVFPPGQVSAYSNYGTALAGYIVQRVTGEPFESYVEKHIFEPLGMAASTFRQPLPTQLAPHLSDGYFYNNGVYRTGGFEFISATPAGAMSAPATDMARFMMAHLQNGRLGEARILEEETVRRMHSRLFTPDPRLDGMAHGFMTMTVNDRRILHHAGDTLLFHTGLYIAPEEGVGLYVSYNALGGALVRDALFRAFMDRYFPSSPAPVNPPADAAQRAVQYVGEYHAARANYTTMEKALQLLQPTLVQLTDEGALRVSTGGTTETYVEVEPGFFRHSERQDRLLFQKDAAGRIWLHFNDFTPFTSYKAPWYATFSFTASLVGGALLLTLLSMFGWVIAFAARRGTGRSPLVAGLARWTAGLFGAALAAFLIIFVSVLGDIHPDYGVPRLFFGEPPLLPALLILALTIVLFALGMAFFAVLSWPKRYWGWFGRLHYSMLTLLALGMVWVLWYWNFLDFTP